MKPLFVFAACLPLFLSFAVSGAEEQPAGSMGKSKLYPSTVSGPAEAAVYDAPSAMEWLRSLKGTWKESDVPGAQNAGKKFSHADEIHLAIIGAGSVVMERRMENTPHELMIMYHMDGPDTVFLRQYGSPRDDGSEQNVPELKFEKSSKAGEITFKYFRGMNVKPVEGSYVSEVTFHIVNKDKFEAITTTMVRGKPQVRRDVRARSATAG